MAGLEQMTSVRRKEKTTNRTELRAAFTLDEDAGHVNVGEIGVVQQRVNELVAQLWRVLGRLSVYLAVSNSGANREINPPGNAPPSFLPR